MNKLKQIIKEIIDEVDSATVWRTEPGTPDTVIDVLHKIKARIMDEQGNVTNIDSYVTLNTFPKSGKGPKTVWIIANRKNPAGGLLYKQSEQNWYSSNPALTAPLNDKIINTLINNWIS